MRSSVSVVAVIPARAGSVGVPGKNLRRVGGLPLVTRAVRTALAAASVDRVVVSTDGLEIASAAAEAGADVVMRPAALSSGSASSESAVTHALDVLEERFVRPTVVVLMQATSPFTAPEELDAAVQRVLAGESDCVFAAVDSHCFLWRLDTTGNATGVNHDAAVRPMRQALLPEFRETGAFYVFDAEGFRRTGHRFFGRIGVALVHDSLDIDTEHDLELADAVAHLQEPAPAVQVRAAQVAAAQTRAAQVRTLDVPAVQVRAKQVPAVQIRAVQIPGVQVRAADGPEAIRDADAVLAWRAHHAEAGRAARPTADIHGGRAFWDARDIADELGAELDEELASALNDDVSALDDDAGLGRIEAVVTDFDGVHTDDTVVVDQNGVESVTVNRRDGLGVRLLREAGIPVLILSTERNPVVAARAAKLGVPVLHGVDDKRTALTEWAAEAGVRLENVAYLGNDVNDLGALRAVGWPFVVRDAHPEAIGAARRVLSARGGTGAVRELAELILQHTLQQKAKA
jgi:YrbI family 3-deoxy-D-manno-octulosonate 8-phosphate phosphatase